MFIAEFNSVATDEKGALLVTLRVEFEQIRKARENISVCKEFISKGKSMQVELSKFSPKRSISANDYFHVLCRRISEKMNSSLEDVKKHLNEKYGTFDEQDGTKLGFKLLAEIDPSKVCPYFKVIGQEEEHGKLFNKILVYKRTSELTNVEMCRLIVGTIEECKEAGIDYTPPCKVKDYDFKK